MGTNLRTIALIGLTAAAATFSQLVFPEVTAEQIELENRIIQERKEAHDRQDKLDYLGQTLRNPEMLAAFMYAQTELGLTQLENCLEKTHPLYIPVSDTRKKLKTTKNTLDLDRVGLCSELFFYLGNEASKDKELTNKILLCSYLQNNFYRLALTKSTQKTLDEKYQEILSTPQSRFRESNYTAMIAKMITLMLVDRELKELKDRTKYKQLVEYRNEISGLSMSEIKKRMFYQSPIFVAEVR
ncbi:MAG: hypothetical protein WC755_05225 [Candidatus Woesearchaeota archaeon]|jgi:hypothetical protein